MGQVDINKVVKVHYTGILPDSGDVFDSSEARIHCYFW